MTTSVLGSADPVEAVPTCAPTYSSAAVGVARSDKGHPVILAVPKAGGQQAEELARDGPVGAALGGARRGVSEASAGLARAR